MSKASPPPPSSIGGKSNIFISYRRDDSAGHTGRLYDQLSQHFGPLKVFMDIDTIEPGDDFVKVIEDAVSSCDVLVAVIGKQWLTSSDGAARRLDNPNDFVRLEIAAALKREIRVIPVLVQDSTMPRERDLPRAIAKLARRNAIQISDLRWKHDVEQLKKTLEKIIGIPKKQDLELSVPPSTSKIDQSVPARTVWWSEGFQKTMAEQRERARVENQRKARARQSSPKFYQLRAWWISLVLTVGVVLGTAFLTEWLISWIVSLFGTALPNVNSIGMVLVLMGLVWTVTYCVVATAFYTDDPERGTSVFYSRGLFGGWTLIWDDFELGAGLAGAFPLTMLMGLVLSRGLAQAAFSFLHGNYSGIVYLVLGAYTIVAVYWYIFAALYLRVRWRSA